MLKAAWDRGVTTWDMANGYSNGETERIIGKALKKASKIFLLYTSRDNADSTTSSVQHSASPRGHPHEAYFHGAGHNGGKRF
jgi:hypothetical protein